MASSSATREARTPVVVLGPDEHWRAAALDSRTPVVYAQRHRFADGEQIVRVPDPHRLTGEPVLLVHTTYKPQDSTMVSLLQLAESVGGAGPARISCFVPYLAYQRQDRRTQPGEPVSSALLPRALAALGVEELLTIDKHSVRYDQDCGLGVRNVLPSVEFAEQLRARGREPDLVVSADAGGAQRAAALAGALALPLVVMEKRKSAAAGIYYDTVPAELEGRRCLVVEDLCSSGSTLQPLCQALATKAADVAVCVSHLLIGYDTVRQRVPDASMILHTDSCGDSGAAVRTLPLILSVLAGERRSCL
jgi:ribose-phosphate pyrophosphokinase